MQLDGKKVLVVGTGKSGIAAIKLLAAKNADIVVLEGNKDADKNDIAQRIGSDISYDLIIGELPVQVMEKIDIAVLSPGVPTDLPFVIELQELNIPVWGEIELAYICGAGKVFAITGTKFQYLHHSDFF